MTAKSNKPDLSGADPAALRDAIMDAAIAHVPFDGWGREAAIRGAEDIGLDAAAAMRAFPDGARDMIAWHLRMADRRMAEALAEMDLASMKIRERIATAVRVRLEQNAQHREAIRKAMAFLALPQNAPMAAQALYRTVDEMWFQAGDTATDWNFYSKRALLAGVYSSTVLFWLNDKSEDFRDTWAFLDRRIADVMKVPKLTGRLSAVLGYPFRRAKAFRNYGVRANS
jgi:ubiquinone biosynthesis protein COQ9